MAPQQTIQQALLTATDSLADVGTSPRLDTELLLCEALGRNRSYLFAHPEQVLDDETAIRFRKSMERRLAGEPVAYILGVQEFWSLPIKVSPHVLVPRPETELLVELTLQSLPGQKSCKVADLGTGSGAIAIALASERPGWQITATDASPQALEQAHSNAHNLEISNITFVSGNWLEPLSGCLFDLIVSNPPYIAGDDPNWERNDFEPVQALESAEQGLCDLRVIVDGAIEYLKPDGYLLLEHGYQQAESVRNLLRERGYAQITSHNDLAGHQRATMATSPAQVGRAQ